MCLHVRVCFLYVLLLFFTEPSCFVANSNRIHWAGASLILKTSNCLYASLLLWKCKNSCAHLIEQDLCAFLICLSRVAWFDPKPYLICSAFYFWLWQYFLKFETCSWKKSHHYSRGFNRKELIENSMKNNLAFKMAYCFLYRSFIGRPCRVVHSRSDVLNILVHFEISQGCKCEKCGKC